VSNEIEKLYEKYKEFWINYHPMVFRRCKEILGNETDAQDAAQDVFEKFWRLKTEGRFNIRSEEIGGLLKKMAINTSINQTRRKRREAGRFFAMAVNISLNRIRDQVKEKSMVTEEIENLAAHYYDKPEKRGLFPDDKAGYTPSNDSLIIDRLYIEDILREEDEKTRDIVYMYHHDKMTLKEIGETVELSTAAVQKRLKKFEEKARLKLGGDKNDGKE